MKKCPAESQVEEVVMEQIDEPGKKKRKKKKDLYAGLNPAFLQNYAKVTENLKKISSPSEYSAKKQKSEKKLTLQKKICIHKELMRIPQPKNKPKQKSLLSSFLETM